MGLLVDVSIQAASIVEAAWARATANRERLRRRLDVQAVREEAARSTINGRGSGLGWELQYTTPTPLQYRPDEPVAYPATNAVVPTLLATAGAFFYKDGIPSFESLTGEPIERFYLWSGDGQSSVWVDRGPFSGAIVALPIGPRSAIILLQWETGETFCFYVDRTSIRAVATPAAASEIDFTRTSRSLGFAVLQVPDVDPRWMNGTFGDPSVYFQFPALFPSFPVSPDNASYAFMRSLIPGLAPAEWLALYSNFSNDYDGSNDGSFIVRITSPAYRWLGDDPSTDGPDDNWEVPFNDSRWASTPIAPFSSSTPIVIGANPSGISVEFSYFWDWNQPDYCREQLLALGFSSADLEP